MFRSVASIVVTALVVVAALGGCTKKSAEKSDAPLTAEELVARGRRTYQASCIACHSPDPKKDGVLGPAVAGSSLELLRMRIIEGTYPEGYTPKRATKVMGTLPHLKNDIEALHAFLEEK